MSRTKGCFHQFPCEIIVFSFSNNWKLPCAFNSRHFPNANRWTCVIYREHVKGVRNKVHFELGRRITKVVIHSHMNVDKRKKIESNLNLRILQSGIYFLDSSWGVHSYDETYKNFHSLNLIYGTMLDWHDTWILTNCSLCRYWRVCYDSGVAMFWSYNTRFKPEFLRLSQILWVKIVHQQSYKKET